MEPVSPVRSVSPDAGDRRPPDDRPRREERADFASAFAQAVAEEEDR